MGNSVPGGSGGGLFVAFWGGRVRVTNCILWGNSATYGPQLALNGAMGEPTCTISYSNVQGGRHDGHTSGYALLRWREGNIDADPCLVLPGYWDPNGTPADFYDDFWVDGDYHLRWDSPCIDAGDLATDPNETDIDDEPRVMGGRIDIGADEVGPKQADLSRDGIINLEDFSTFLESFGSGPTDPNWYILSDLYKDDWINYNDLAILVHDWLWQAPWYDSP